VQKQVDDLLTAGHQPVVQRLDTHRSHRTDRELERMTAHAVGQVGVACRCAVLVEPGMLRGGHRRDRQPVEQMPLGGVQPELLEQLALLDEGRGCVLREPRERRVVQRGLQDEVARIVVQGDDGA
jgi:hypothetical protein